VGPRLLLETIRERGEAVIAARRPGPIASHAFRASSTIPLQIGHGRIYEPYGLYKDEMWWDPLGTSVLEHAGRSGPRSSRRSRCGSYARVRRLGKSVRAWLSRFDDLDGVHFALEGTTGWRFVVEEIERAGHRAHLADPAETAARRGRKRRAKTASGSKTRSPRSRGRGNGRLASPSPSVGGRACCGRSRTWSFVVCSN
jgi:hypothetical protein